MNLPELQTCLDRLRVKLSLRLVVDAPVGAMTAEIRAARVNHKPGLLARLAGAEFQSKSTSRDLPELDCERSEPGIGHVTLGRAFDPPSEPTSIAALGVVDPADAYACLERAAIMEFDGGLTRDEAERKAGL
jgi:hypothetical protein